VKQQLAFWRAQVKGLLDSFEDDIQLLQLVDDLKRPFQPARQAVDFMDVKNFELAAAGILAHGIDPRTVLLTVSRLGWVCKDLDDLDAVAFCLLLDLSELSVQAE